MKWYHPVSILDKVFEGGLIIKGISGVIEFVAGLILFFVAPDTIHKFLAFVTQRELTEDPKSKLANVILHSANHLNTGNKSFLIIYLWLHAFIKLIAVGGILLNKLWAYPFSLATLGALMIYQVYSIAVRPSLGMIALTIFDVFILWLIWREYGKARHNANQATT